MTAAVLLAVAVLGGGTVGAVELGRHIQSQRAQRAADQLSGSLHDAARDFDAAGLMARDCSADVTGTS